MKSKQYFTFMVMLTVVSFGIPAIADLTFYTDRSDWEVAVNGDIVIENFDSLTPYVLTEGVNSAGLIDIKLINLVQTNEFNYIDDGIDWSDFTPFFHGALRRDDPDSMINLVLPFSVRAFGGDFKSTNSVDGLWLEVNGEQYAFGDERLLPLGDGSGFLGFVSTDTFSTVTLFNPVQGAFRLGESFDLDNVSYAVVPEPVTLSLLGLGGLCLRKHRKI